MIARDPSLEEAIRVGDRRGRAGSVGRRTRRSRRSRRCSLDLGGYMAERVADLDDVRDRTVARLLGLPMPGVPERATRSSWSPTTSPRPTP